MPITARPLPPAPRAIPIAPTEEQWRAMSPAEREKVQVAVNEALTDQERLMPEGQPHKKAKSRAMDMLGLHFKAMGRAIYVAEDMSVLYPGEKGFAPDILAVLDVEQPEDDERLSWVVLDEGKGLDFVLEVLHCGDRNKDLVENVERYARLGIPEYFVYDRARQKILGYRLPAAGAKRYEPIVPQLGRYHSAVLGLDLALQSGRLRFFEGMAELFGSADLLDRLTYMMQDVEARADEAEAKAEQAAAQAITAEAKAEQAAAQASEARAQASEARAQASAAEARAEQALAGLRAGVLAVLSARGIVCSDEERSRLMACDDPARLQEWLSRAAMATSAAEALS
jgi:Uma2 family endonuclease